MKFIFRPKKEPKELVYFRKKYSEWGEIYPEAKVHGKNKNKTTKDRDEKARKKLKSLLIKMQNRRCAYCEILLKDEKDASIEHFVPRSSTKGCAKRCKNDFEWENLFISCLNDSSCGTLKADKLPEDVFKPDNLNQRKVEEYFGYNPEGEVFALSGLNEENERRANNTIEFFGLNCPSLVNKRKRALMLMKSKFHREISIMPNDEQKCAEISANYVKGLQGFDGSCEFWQTQLDLLRDYKCNDVIENFLE